MRRPFLLFCLLVSQSGCHSLKIAGRGTATVSWSPVDWGQAVNYRIGWGLKQGNYLGQAQTSATAYQVTGLRPNTFYYFSVKTQDAAGLSSPWSSAVKCYVKK